MDEKRARNVEFIVYRGNGYKVNTSTRGTLDEIARELISKQDLWDDVEHMEVREEITLDLEDYINEINLRPTARAEREREKEAFQKMLRDHINEKEEENE